jgi:large subunit ribosomal protein L13
VTGQTRPDFTPKLFTPDQVVVINVKDTVMVGDNWLREPIKWESPFSGGKMRVRASELFERDPCMLFQHCLRQELQRFIGGPYKRGESHQNLKLFTEYTWLYEDALHPHADENPRPIRWMGKQKGDTYKFNRPTRWFANPQIRT